MNVTVHILSAGLPLCRFAGVPRDWPDGHKWVAKMQAELATCAECKRLAAQQGAPE